VIHARAIRIPLRWYTVITLVQITAEEISMRPATATVANAAPQTERPVSGRARFDSSREESLLKVDLSDLVLPKVNDLHVDGLKPNWFARLFGKR